MALWRERHYGPDHPHTLNARYNLASYLLARERFAEARGIAEDVVAHQRRIMGERHDRLGASLRVLARALLGEGEAEAALPPIAEALSIHRERFGPAHFQVAIDLTGLGVVEAYTRHLTGGVDHCLQAMALLENQKSATPRDLATARLYVGIVLLEAARLEDADRELARAAAEFSQEGGTQILLGRALDAQGALALRRGQAARAVSLGRQAVSVLERVASSDGPTTLMARVHLGAALWADGAPGDGEPLLRTGVEKLDQAFPAGHPELASARLLLGQALRASGHAAESRPLLTSALEWRLAHLGPTDPRTLAARQALDAPAP